MNRKWFYVPVLLLTLGAGGFFLAPVIQQKWFPQKPANLELEQTKKMLRQSFERNKELVDQLSGMDQRHVELIRQLKEKDEELKSLATNLQNIDRLEAELKQRQSEEKKIEMILAKKIGSNRVLRDQRNKMNREIEQTSEELKKIKEENEKLRTEQAQLQSEPTTNLLQQGMSPAGENADWSAEYQLTKKLEKLEDENRNLNENLGALKSQLDFKMIPGKMPTAGEYQKLVHELQDLRASRSKDHVTFLYNLGVAYTEARLFHNAAQMYERVLKLDPRDASAHYNLGILYEEHLNERDKALKHYEAFLSFSNDKEKKQIVENWIQIARHKIGSEAQSRSQSSRDAFEHIFLTDAT